jgi:hypothetical protein
MIDLKPYGAFAQHTLRPLIEDITALLDKLEAKGVRLKEIRSIMLLHFATTLLNAAVQIICTIIACYTAFRLIPCMT